jgi:hypothetical protein
MQLVIMKIVRLPTGCSPALLFQQPKNTPTRMDSKKVKRNHLREHMFLQTLCLHKIFVLNFDMSSRLHLIFYPNQSLQQRKYEKAGSIVQHQFYLMLTINLKTSSIYTFGAKLSMFISYEWSVDRSTKSFIGPRLHEIVSQTTLYVCSLVRY